MISDAGNAIFLSPATYWEIAIKVSLRKWILNRPYQELVDIAVVKYGFQILPILPTHTERLLNLPFHHRDPFDRLLISQAMVEQLSVISADTAFDAYPIERHW